MAKGFKSGGSGSLPAGLKIVGNPRPSNPKEGTVWVNTDTEITGHVLSATQPENPTTGMLWINISDSSRIKAGTPLGKDYITIMLNSVSQYIGGAWVDVEAKSFQNGVWVDWLTYIFKSREGILKEINFQLRPENVTVTNDAITVNSSGGIAFAMKEAVDMSKYKSIKVECIITQNIISEAYAGALCMSNTNAPGTSDTFNTSIFPMIATLPVSTERQIVELKLGITGNLYPAIAGIFAGTIYNWWLE